MNKITTSPTVSTRPRRSRASYRMLATGLTGALALAACGSDDSSDSADSDPVDTEASETEATEAAAGDTESTEAEVADTEAVETEGTEAAETEGTDADDSDQAGLLVATTVAPITSIAANIIGERASIVGIVPEGTNSHTFEPLPSNAELLSEADVVFINGLVLEEPTKELALANMADAAPLVELGDETIDPEEYKYDFSFPEDEGKPNPHLWTDPSLALTYAEIVRDTMSEVDPDGAEAFAENYDAFVECVDGLDAAMREAFETIPEENKLLLTYHDAYAYFADNYGFEVVGAIQPNDFGDPSAQEVAELIEQVESEGVPALFGSEVFPSPVLDQIASETGGTYVDTLRDDDLPGAPGDEEHSWVGLMRSNYITMTEALGGDPTALEDFEVCGAATDNAEYPQ